MAALLVSTTLLSGACAGGGGGDGNQAAAGSRSTAEGSTSSTGTPPCSQERHMAVFDWAGMLTASQDDWGDWIQGLGEPEARAGGPEVVQAYRERGYEILYITTVPPNVLIEGVPVPVAVEGWLQRNGFPVDDKSRVFGFAGSGSDQPNAPILSITDELLRVASEDVQLDAGYTENADKAYAFASGGIPANGIYMLGEEAGVSGTSVIANDDMAAHLATVQELPQVCTPDD